MSALEIQNLQIEITEEEKNSLVVKDFSIRAPKGEITGIIGESGAGKSMSMKALLGILPGNARMEYTEMMLNGIPYKPDENAGRIAWIPQNSSAALDPVFRIGAQMQETVRAHEKCSKKAAKERSKKLLMEAGLTEPEQCLLKYPFELSGGMCQRVAAAMAVASAPQVVIADEPTASLDLKTQKKVLDFLLGWVEENQTAVLMVSHDLCAARKFCQSLNVMQDGIVIESGRTQELSENPVQPYTKLLLGSITNEMSGTL